MTTLLFVLALSSIVAMLLLFGGSVITKRYQFFPPPDKETWQYRVFWGLFRTMFVSLVAISFLDFAPLTSGSRIFRLYIGMPLLGIGMGSALYLTAKLGWQNAHGESSGLVTTGCYRFSRNPVYVASIVGMLGWAVLVNSADVSILLALWALLYIGAPWVEEPWLEARYGNEFKTYKTRVSRFFGLPSK